MWILSIITKVEIIGHQGWLKWLPVVKIVKTLTNSICEVFLDVSSISCSLDLLSPYFLENPGSFCNCLSVSGQAVSVKVHRSSTYHVKCAPWEASLRLICGLPPVNALFTGFVRDAGLHCVQHRV